MNFITTLNKKLLENYPLLWNTKIIWMVLVNLIIHFVFFLIGYLTVNNLADIKSRYNLESFYFNDSALYYNLLISIIILLVWVIFYLRNNAFKSNYSFNKNMLFKQFCCILFIVFISISQFFSFKAGLTLKIRSLYDWEEVKKDINKFNKLALFLVQNEDDYDIKNKEYPKPFPLKIAISNENIDNVDTSKTYLKKDSLKYQFYHFNESLWNEDVKQNPSLKYFDNKSDFKYRIVKDVSAFKAFLEPSLFNFSKTTFEVSSDFSESDILIKFYEEILTKNDKYEIRTLLENGIVLADKYEIKHNLTVEKWFPIVYNPLNFILTETISTSNPKETTHYSDYNYNRKINYIVPFSKELFFDFGKLDDFFKNVYFSYHKKFDYDLFCFLIGLALFFSIVLFVFKTTTLKSVLFTVVAFLILLTLFTWIMSSSLFTNHETFFYKYKDNILVVFIALVVFSISIISYLKRWPRIIIHISWILNLFSVPMIALFMILGYAEYYREKYSENVGFNSVEYKVSYPEEVWIFKYSFWVYIFVTVISIFIYSRYIRKLKAIPK
jgi:hypothetical protein